jgi:hypothetical protein
MYQHEAPRLFLITIRPDSRAWVMRSSLTTLGSPDPGLAGYASSQLLIPTLSLCVKLRSLNLNIAVSNVFRGDIEALKVYFLSGTDQPLISAGLEKFASTLSGMPRVEYVHLGLQRSSRLCSELDIATERFLCFAFSGVRAMRLWTEMKERHLANKSADHGNAHRLGGRVLVRMGHCPYLGFDGGEEMTDYVDWVRWQCEHRFGLLR